MTPEEQYKLLRGKSRQIDKAVDDAYRRLVELIQAGVVAEDALRTVIESFEGDFAEIYAAGLSTIVAEQIGAPSAMAQAVGRVTLSQRFYAQADATAVVVRGVIERHTRGFQSSRELALELYEGYDFRSEEVINIDKRNHELPRYMREALLDDPRITRGFKRAYARLQVDKLSTPALRAAYEQALRDIDRIEDTDGARHLNNKLRVAFFERMRYFARRIAETELHRRFAQQQAKELLADDAVQFVQWRLSPAHPVEDICDYFAGLNRYGLGPGVYPKRLAPVAPAHPFCKCVLSPRLDLNGRQAQEIQDAEARFFARYPQKEQRLIAGSEQKLEKIKSGRSAWDVHNERIEPEYQVKPASQV